MSETTKIINKYRQEQCTAIILTAIYATHSLLKSSRTTGNVDALVRSSTDRMQEITI